MTRMIPGATRPTLFAIDFGTHACRLSVLNSEGHPVLVPMRTGEEILPAAVAFVGGGSSWTGALVGTAARRQLAAAPRSGVVGIKRFLGRRHDDVELKRLAGSVVTVLAAGNGDAAIDLVGRIWSPVELAASLFAALRLSAEEHAGGTDLGFVVTIPSAFDQAARQALYDAAILAGLKIVRLLGEPTAAALGCGLQRRPRTRAAVCDLGAGGCAVSILAVEAGVIEVLATAGERAFGDDFDRRIAARLHGEGAGLDLRMLEEVQRLKHAVMESGQSTFQVSGGEGGSARTVKRHEIEGWTRDLVDRLDEACHQALAGAQIKSSDIREVIVVGGASRLPAAVRKIEQVFGRPAERQAVPENAVAFGAAQYTGFLDGAADGVLAIDATARTLGLRAVGGKLAAVLPRGTPLPAHAERLLTTTRDGQRDLGIDLFEGAIGEGGAARFIGRYVVTGLPEGRAGETMVLVDIRLNGDGLVGLSARLFGQTAAAAVRFLPASGLARSELERLSAS